MPKNPLQERISSLIADFEEKIEAELPVWTEQSSPVEFRDLELQLAAFGRSLCDDLMEVILRKKLSDTGFKSATLEAAKASGTYRSGGRRDVSVTLLGGSKVRVKVEYLKPNLRGKKRGRKRKSGRRGAGGSGLYPSLAALGICWGVTPALAGEICRQVADSESVRAGRKALARRGIDLGHKQTLRIVNKFGGRAIEQRNDWLEHALEEKPGEMLAGKRVVVAIDGGRVRMRVPVRRGRRRKNGHRSFKTPWQEPKLFVIYVIDEEGRIDKTFRPIYDGTMGDCEAVFGMLHSYLRALGVAQSKELVFVGDGAKWIWERVGPLANALGIPADRVFEVLDCYHGLEHLHEIASIPNWTDIEKTRWLRRVENLLWSGQIDKFIRSVESLAKGRRSKKIKKLVPYFKRNRERIQYRYFKRHHVPTGSGAVESAIRRVVNLRLKGNSKFWLVENAESMLFLRCYVKTDRFDNLVDWSLTTSVPWWDSGGNHPLLCCGTAKDERAWWKAA